RVERTLASGATVADLLAVLAVDFPALPTASGTIYAAVNKAYAREDAVLHDRDEVAFFPPVSGGQDRKLFEITAAPLSLDEVASRVAAPSHGAITVFAGMVRGETDLTSPFAAAPPEVAGNDGGTRLATEYLEYEAYAEMAEPMLAALGDDIRARWPQITAVSILHRIGRIEVGEASVVIAVAAAHRKGTFDACSYAIERLKAVVPIWKKEVGSDGQWWVEGPREANDAPAVGELRDSR
ncbi:MAG: molybdenum cofactor biosynthesis protein MoaE, partial [Anaerolineae bacterium]|nr:molybdenum cofactor biosynthesis protein MoaE [Anaerolineae bacterium]